MRVIGSVMIGRYCVITPETNQKLEKAKALTERREYQLDPLLDSDVMDALYGLFAAIEELDAEVQTIKLDRRRG